MQPKTNDATLAASAVDRNETASAFETGRGAPSGSPVDLGFLAPAQQPDEIGRLGNYRALAVLGHGGMGLVFRAEDPALRRQVAIKVMLPRFASDPHARARFIREAQAQAAVEHDHIVPIFGVNDGEPPFIVMPLLKGLSLADALKANARPPLPAILRIGREIAEGLAAAHESGLIHRDIKPANIWLEGSKLRVRILDFGLARAAEATDPAATGAEPLTADGAVVGTPMYMSPEQAKGEHLDARTDLFSLGVILYQMVTGELPFHGRTTASVLLAVVSHEPKGLKNAAVPPAFKAIIERLLTKDRDAAGRPAAAAVVAYELGDIERCLAVAPVQVVALDSIPMAAPVANPFEVLETTAADAEPAAKVVREKRPVSKAWVFGGIAALLAVVVAAVLMFQAMTKSDPPVVKNEESAPVPPKPILKPKTPDAEQRRSAEAFLEAGGGLTVIAGGTEHYPRKGDKLPAGPFTVYEASIFDVPADEARLDALRALPDVAHAVRINGAGLTNQQFIRLSTFPNLRRVRALNLLNNPIDGEGFAALKNLPDVTWLDLSGTKMDDASLVHLNDRRVTWLSLHGCSGVTDAGMDRLAEQTGLTHLWLHLSGVSPRGIEKLAGLQQLIYLHPGKVDDANIDAILKFPVLNELHLEGTSVAAGHLARLAVSPKLRILALSGTAITDADLESLARYPNLETLALRSCAGITDGALAHLAKCKKLTSLNLVKTKVTKPAVDALS